MGAELGPEGVGAGTPGLGLWNQKGAELGPEGGGAGTLGLEGGRAGTGGGRSWDSGARRWRGWVSVVGTGTLKSEGGGVRPWQQ